MDRVELRILYQDGNSSKLRCIVNKWKFQDAMMGEQYLTFTITSETPIDWAVGDFCVFRGETYTLNYVPSVTQKAGTKERQDAYTYENVKFESHQEELTRCIMLDITASTGLYIAALGTNYTGSSKFPLYCGETSVGGDTLTPVCALAAKMQANLDRMYGGVNAWKIFVDTTTTFVNAVGDTVLVTHTDDKQLSFDNTTVAQALAEVHNTFDLDYCIRGRNIYIGYNLKNLTSDNDEETFAFGYGKGYPTHDDMNKGLFQIKRMANPQQKIVTRLRALGSTKNMPYRYYNKKYNLSQSLFPTNLQLPDTFETSATKATHNAQRDPSLSHVKGDTNDSYIDKNNNAAACAEGIREDCARWDGSNGDLVEIYPTIEGATYGELRGALVEDQDGNTGNGSFPNYSADERIDKLLAVGYKDGSTLVDDANKGDGILPESGISSTAVVRSADIGQTSLTYGRHNQFAYNGGYYAGKDHTLFTIQGVMPGKYAMAPTIGSTFFGFSLSCYRDGCSADVGFQIIIKQKNQQTGVVTTLATYTSDLESIERSDGVKEIELPELPDVVNGANAKVNEIRVTAMSDITVTFRMIMRNVVMPSGFTDDFSISYKVGNSRLDHSVTYEPEYTWFPVDDSDSIVDRFHVFIQDMGFDLEACWSDETPMLVMKSGRCVGREFEILQDIQKVTHNNKKGYMLTLKRAEDSSLNTYYPSQTDPIAADDTFVLLGIQMPEAYVKMAEVRLLRAATQYLADNCETKFTYQPSIDDIYLQRNYDNMVQAGTPNKSIFWRLYAGLKFTFRGVPTSEDSPAPLADITIEKVTISMGEGLTPKVELTLNDDVQQGTIQKLTTSVDRIYNGSIFASGSGNGASGAMSAALLSLLQSEGEKLFLSKTHDDTAAGKITFNDVVTHNETLKAKKGIKVGNFQSRFLGSGALIDEEGNAEFESIYSRNFISTPEFRFNRITVTEGENWCTNGFGTIKEVEIIDDTTGYITLKLEENDYASIETGDICRGIYNDIANQYETASLDDDTELYAGENEGAGYGFSSKEGFFTSYFWVRSFVENKKGECKFMYELRNSGTPHPCAFMKFAQYGSFTNANRRSSSYSTSIGHYYEMVLDGVSTWKIRSANVVYRKGYLGNMTVTLKNGHEAELQGYGLYVQDNVYFGNAIVQLDPETLAEIEESLKSYEVNFSGYVDVITVDDVGNCIGGLWTVSGENNEYRNYRIHSAITVRKSGNLLILAGNNEDAGEGTFKIYAQPIGCTCVIENSTIYITGIDNIKDGVAGSHDDANFDYDAMRNMESCSVDIIIDCEGKGSIQKNFPVRIKHDSQPFVGADISNEFSAVSWNTQTQAYVGLPITFDMKMWHNNEILDIASTDNVSLASATGGVTLVNGTAPATPAASSIYYSKSIITDGVTGKKHARISINAMGENLPNVIDIDVTSTATYSGVSYERTLRHTINRSTDTNVYQLHPSVGEVGVIYNDNKEKVISTNKVYTDVRCDSTDDKHYTVATSDYAKHGLFITYQTFTLNASDQEVASAEAAYSTLNGVTVSNTYTRIRFKLYKLVDTTLSPLSALLDSTNVIEVLDTEDVPVILDGLDGDNSIAVHLDNANDAVMCLEDGTVIASTLPVARARLMDGEDTIGRSVLGTTLPENKQTLGNWSLTCHSCTAEFVGWVTDSDSNDWVSLRVTGVSDDVASVDVQCQYTKHGVTVTYISILTVKKIYGLDKYELTFDPPVISYNPNTDTYTPESFTVYVWKTTQEEDRHLMTTLPGSVVNNAVVASDGNIRLQYSVNNGVSWTDLTGYASGKSIGKTLFDIAGVEHIDFRIQKYVTGESGGEWVMLDEEGVEIRGDGENVIQLIIDNGNDSVVCLEDGTVIASTLPYAKVYLNDGNDMVNTSLAASVWQTLECVGCTAEWVSGYQSDGGKRFNVTAVTADVARVTAKVSYKGNIYQVVHNIKKMYGLDKYEIITDPVSIAYNPNTGLHTPTAVNVYVYLTTQEEDRHLMTSLPSHVSATDGDVRLQYSVDNGSNWNALTGYSSGVTITRNSHYSSIMSGAVLLRVQKYVTGESGGEWVMLDEEGVEITRSGQDGKGVEYVFFRQNTESPMPTLLARSDLNDTNDPLGVQRAAYLEDDYCPYTDASHIGNEDYHWTDEQQGVGENARFEFYAMRKKVNGVWQPFGTVKIFNRYTVDGQSPYIIDLTNEQSLVNCDQNGTPLTGFVYPASEVLLLYGPTDARSEFTIKVVPTGISCNGYYPNGGTAVSGQTECPAGGFTLPINGSYILYPSVITQDAATIAVTATKGNITLVATYKLNKNKAGEQGVIYELMPSLNVVHKNKLGQFEDTYLDVSVKKIVGSTPTIIDTIAGWDAEGFILKYSQGDSSTQNTLGTFSNISTATLCGNSSSFTLYLYASDGTTLLDKERINVVIDGKDSRVYYAHPSRTSIDFHSDGDGAAFTPSSVQINCGYKRVEGENEQTFPGNVLANLATSLSNDQPIAGCTYTAPYNIFYRYVNADGTFGSWGWMRNTPSTSAPTGIITIPNTTTYIGIEFVLSSATGIANIADGNIVSRITVPINKISDGDTGPEGEDADFHEIAVIGTNYGVGTRCHLDIDGVEEVYSTSRGITMVILDSDLDVYAWNSYDVWADDYNGDTYYTDQLLSDLRSYGSSDKIVCLMSYDSIYIHDRLWAKLGCEYGVGKKIAMSQRDRYGLAIICQKGMLPGQATVVMTDNGNIAEAKASVSNGVLIIQSTDHISLGQNLLQQTNFDMVTAWRKHNGVVVENDCEGCNAYQCASPSSSFTDYLEQAVSDINSGVLKNGTWYTLSFYGRGDSIRTHVYPLAIDTSEKVYIDGVEATAAGNGQKDWTLDNMYRLHTYTFKTLPRCVYSGSYSSGTSYSKGEIVAVSGDPTTYYVSLVNSNQGNAVSNTSYWKQITVDSSTLTSGFQRFALAAYVLWRKISGGSTAYVSKMKLEEGVWCTSWQKSEHDRMGLSGCHERVFESFNPSQTYYNEEADLKEGVRYVDFLAIEDSTMSSGYKVYQCNETHQAALTFAADIGFWTEVNVNAAAAFFKYLIAKNANIKILSSAQFTIMDGNNGIAGLANTQTPLWIGHATPDSAPFRVTRAGKMYATDAEVSGVVNATSGVLQNIETKNAKISGSIYTPALTITSENFSTYHEASGSDYELKIADAGLSLIYTSFSGSGYLKLPTGLAYKGAEIRIINGVGQILKVRGISLRNGNTSGQFAEWYDDGKVELNMGDVLVLRCDYFENTISGNAYRWLPMILERNVLTS